MSWEFSPAFDAGHRAALRAGKNLIYVCPPAWWATRPLYAQLHPAGDLGLHTLIIVPPAAGVAEGVATLRASGTHRAVHGVSGLARTVRLLREQWVAVLIAAPTDVLQLATRSSIDRDRLERVVVSWPEMLEDHAEAIDTVLAEFSSAQRIVITADEGRIAGFVERHARRAPVVGAARLPEGAGESIRYAVTDVARTSEAVQNALDILNPTSTLVWDPTPFAAHHEAAFEADRSVAWQPDPDSDMVELAIATDLPSSEVLALLRAVAREVVVLVRPGQVRYLQQLAGRLRPLRLPSEVDRARDAGVQLREDVRSMIESGAGGAALLALAPLFDEYDPTVVAAALASRSEVRAGASATTEQLPSWVRIHVNAGQRDQVRTADLVGALLNAIGIPKNNVGRVELRDAFALIEVRAEVAQRALRGLDGLVVRGKKLAARIDRR